MITENITKLLSDSNLPRLAAVSPAHKDIVVCAAQEHAFSIWTLDGRKMKNDETVFEHFAEVLRFPGYFGRNWDAMDECLRDMEWAPADAHLIVINDADNLFLTSPSTFYALVDCLRFVAKHWHEWQNKHFPFKVVFVTKNQEIASMTDLSFIS